MNAVLSATRRELMISVVAASAAATAPQQFGRGNWGKALTVYVSARKEHERFLQEVLDPAVRAARVAGLGLTAKITSLEEQGDDLYVLRHETLLALLTMPAPTLHAAHLKLRLAYEDVLRFEEPSNVVRYVIADFDRLDTSASKAHALPP